MFVGVDLHPDCAHVVAVDATRVVASLTVPRDATSDELAGPLSALVAQCPAAASTRSVTVCRTGDAPSLIRPEALSPVACLRIAPTTASTAPALSGWPAALADAVGRDLHVCLGGHRFDGSPAQPLDVDALARLGDDLADRGVSTLAITSAFSPVDDSAEHEAAALLHERHPRLDVCLSHEIGGLGLLERENATILNAALRATVSASFDELTSQVARVLPRAGLHIAQSDGTVAEEAHARRFPLRTLHASESCLLVGAAALTGHHDCVVVEARDRTLVIGTTRHGVPRQAPDGADYEGVRLNLRRPATWTLPRPNSGDDRALRHVHLALGAADQTRRLPVVAVGHEPPPRHPSLSFQRPDQAEHCRALGAVRSPIGGEVSVLLSGDVRTRNLARERAKRRAIQRTLLAGAADGSVEIVECHEIPLSYLPGDVAELHVRTIGRRPDGRPPA